MGRKLLARVALAAVLCTAHATQAATAPNIHGSLGNVTDSSGAAIPGATVTATQTETNLTSEVVTDATGAHTISDNPSGTYQEILLTLKEGK